MFNIFKPKPVQPKTLGQRGEEFAQGEYKKRGYRIVVANFFNKKGLRKGEVDFIAKNKQGTAELLTSIGLSPQTRPETVDIAHWLILVNSL